MLSFKQLLNNIWRNRNAYERKHDGSPQSAMDYAAWRAGYDGREKSRISAGITNGRVFRRAEDPNDVVILQDVADVAKARTWLASDETKAAREKGGVIGSPNIRFAT